LPHAEITEEPLRELYLQRKLSIPQIAELVGWGRETVRQRMIEYGIPIRSFSQANLIQFGTYDEYRDFDGNAQQKAYLIGFRLGDLTVTRTNKTSDMIYVSGGSSKREQIELFEHLFAQYGHVTRSSEVRLSLRGFLHYQNFRVTLKSSFDFLLEYPIGIPSWVLDDDSIFVAFFGGFTDAEGSFGASLPQRRYGSLASNKKNLCSV
jgi:hypothetical protein